MSQSLIARIELGEVDPSYSTLRSVVGVLNAAEGKQTALSELMVSPVIAIGPGERVKAAVSKMRDHGFSQLPVLDGGVAVGSVTEESLVHALAEAEPGELASTAVKEVMGPPFPALAPEEAVDVALRMLEDRAAVLVVEKGNVVGVVTKSDLIGAVA